MSQIIPAGLLALGLLYGPGLIAVCLVGLRGLAALALAPALTLASSGTAGLIATVGGSPGWVSTLTGWLVLVALAAAARRLIPIHTPRPLPSWTFFQWTVVGLAGLLATGLLVYLAHQQSRWPVTDQLAPRTPWHDLGDLIGRLVGPSSPGQPPAGQVGLAVVSSVVVWLVSVVYLQRVLFPGRPALALAGVLLALAYHANPAAMPPVGLPSEGAALALVPGLVAWSIQLARVSRLRSTGRGSRLALLTAGLVGVGLTHPFGVIAYLSMALPGAIALIGRWLARVDRAWLRWLSPAAVAAGGVGLAAMVASSQMPSHLPSPTGQTGVYLSRLLAPAAALADWTAYYPWWPNLLVAWLVVAGALAVIQQRRWLWLVGAYGLVLAWYAVAVVMRGSQWDGHRPWYLCIFHLAPLLCLSGLPLMTIALSQAAERWRDLAAAVTERWRAGSSAERLWIQPTQPWRMTFALVEAVVLAAGLVALAGGWVGRLAGWLVR